jgi:hypothetical protein
MRPHRYLDSKKTEHQAGQNARKAIRNHQVLIVTLHCHQTTTTMKQIGTFQKAVLGESERINEVQKEQRRPQLSPSVVMSPPRPELNQSGREAPTSPSNVIVLGSDDELLLS